MGKNKAGFKQNTAKKNERKAVNKQEKQTLGEGKKGSEENYVGMERPTVPLVVKKPKLQELMMSNTPTVVLSKDLQNQIVQNHGSLPKNTEWSGTLIFRELSGSLLSPDNFKIKAEALWLQDIGSHSYTDFEPDMEGVFDMMDQFPGLEDGTEETPNTLRTGLIHTHHHMDTFFSGTDQSELHDNADSFVYYLSLIVNYDGRWCARIATVVEEKASISIKNATGTEDSVNLVGTKKLACYDCNVVLEEEDWAAKRKEQMIAVYKAKPKQTYKSFTPVVTNNKKVNNTNNEANKVGGVKFPVLDTVPYSQIAAVIGLWVSSVKEDKRSLIQILTTESARYSQMKASEKKVLTDDLEDSFVISYMINYGFSDLEKTNPDHIEKVLEACQGHLKGIYMNNEFTKMLQESLKWIQELMEIQQESLLIGCE